jgi:hypothetical protein
MFGRKGRKPLQALGPWKGEYYGNVARIVRGGQEESEPYTFTDGSWADPVTGDFYNAAGDGSMIAVTGDEADAAAKALFGSMDPDGWHRHAAFGSVDGP